jgi:hypothetical protein
MGALALTVPATCMAEQSGGWTNGAAFGGTAVALLAFLIAIDIAMIWVARDAKARGINGGLLWMWMLSVFFLGPLGIVLYLLVRPRGSVYACPKCVNDRLQTLIECPHCGLG